MIGVILAVLGLGFLIFIHELGHYIMAKKVGMRVETFSIGFGSPLISWTRPNGEKWQLGFLPFGGFVKIAGTERQKGENLYLIEDGFFGKTPWARIQVAFMGPFVNIIFALIVFSSLSLTGGRQISFGSSTTFVGAIEKGSPLDLAGVSPGDEILSYGDQPFKGQKSHLLAPMSGEGPVPLHVRLHDWKNGTHEEKTISLEPVSFKTSFGATTKTFGLKAPATFLVFNRPWEKKVDLFSRSPLEASGIRPGDLIVSYDGEPIFSQLQLTEIVQEDKTLLTVQRGVDRILLRVPRVPLDSLKLDPFTREEILDWEYEAGLHGQSILFIPYGLSPELIVEEPLRFIDPEESGKMASYGLKPGDRILSVDTQKVDRAPELLKALQTKKGHLIVYRGPFDSKMTLEEASTFYQKIHDKSSLDPILSSFGEDDLVKESGPFVLLHGVTPKPFSEWLPNPPENDKRLYLGLSLAPDILVKTNPSVTEQLADSLDEIVVTLRGLIFGQIDPKLVSGPVGIIHVMSDSSSLGLTNSFFWLALISLNLAVINLLPLPILDGGTILFSLIEMVTKRPSLQMMDKLLFPFGVLITGFLVYFTYHDLVRLFGRWLGF